MLKFLRKLRKFLKVWFDKLDNEKLKRNILNALPFWIGALIAGAVAVLYAYLFSLAEKLSGYILSKGLWLIFLLAPLCFLTGWWLVKKFAPFSRGSGIPQVTAAIELSKPGEHQHVNQLLGLKVLVVKIISSIVMVIGGASIGREGPTIQISASIFKRINDTLPEWYPKISRRNMIVTGAAAGLAAAFNTPLGGIVFAIEELTKTHFNFFKSALLTGVIIAGLTALYFLGPYLYLGYPRLNIIPAWIVLSVIPLALITGAAGTLMGSLILYVLKKKSKRKSFLAQGMYALVFGLCLASLAYFIHTSVLGSGKDIMVQTLFTTEKNLHWYEPLLRIAGTVISFTAGAAGGVFAPSLAAGASIGSVYSGWFNLAPDASNLLILCGMTGFLTSITRSPFTSSILVLEMTDSHSVIFYIMLTALISNLLATVISRHGFYDHLKTIYLKEIHESHAKPASKTIMEHKSKQENFLCTLFLWHPEH